ncbi:MAG: hypothetical protein U9Q34_04910, partial [Elusimicrobiota bacterium]|nr:hypothetical protein [Elusimicrobiota bacterium]
WVIIVHGLFSMMAGIMTILMIVALISRMKHPGDERDWQIQYISTYGSFFATISFLFIYQAIEFLQTGKENPLAIVTIGFLVFSQGMFAMLFKGKEKI